MNRMFLVQFSYHVAEKVLREVGVWGGHMHVRGVIVGRLNLVAIQK